VEFPVLGTGENLEVVGGVVGGSAVDVVDVDEGATGWHGMGVWW